MEENLNSVPASEPGFIARGSDFAFGGAALVLGILMCNFVLYGGFHLAFGLMAAASIGASWLYLKKSGHRFGSYEKALLVLSVLICLGFGRSDDGGIKLIMLLFLFVAVNLALCIGAGQNRRSPDGAMSLLDAPRAFYRLGFGNLGRSASGLAAGFRQGGTATRRISAVGTGLLISIPLLLVMVSLLTSADAAFEGLMDLLPDMELEEYFHSALWGFFLAWILYTRGISLAKDCRPAPADRTDKGINALTMNTVLIMVCLVYVVYLFSQLAYLSGGLSGILPEEYTLAEYARRGFFEMAQLCGMNLGLLCLVIWKIRQEKLPRLTKIAGTFLAAITIFLVLTASAKMVMYIGSYGLTRLRVLTTVIMVFLAITTALVCIWLYLPKLQYMQAVMLLALSIGAAVLWLDVDTQVAKYNVNHYLSGDLQNVDVHYLVELGPGAVEYLDVLANCEDPYYSAWAKKLLKDYYIAPTDDFREMTYVNQKAWEILESYHPTETAEVADTP